MGSDLKLEDVGSVSEAELVVEYHESDGEIMEYALELLSGLFGVEKLKIDGNVFKKTIEGELPKCPTFFKLKNLTLGKACMYCNFELILSFLKRCPNLEHLTLLHRHKYHEDGNVDGLLQVERFNIGCKRLKKIEIQYSNECHVEELKLDLWISTLEIKDLEITSIPIWS